VLLVDLREDHERDRDDVGDADQRQRLAGAEHADRAALVVRERGAHHDVGLVAVPEALGLVDELVAARHAALQWR